MENEVRDLWSMGNFPASSRLLCQGSGRQRQTASGILSSMLALPNQSSQKSQGPEEKGASTSHGLPSPPAAQHRADSAQISLVKGSWPFHVKAHYTHAVSPLSAGKTRQLIHFSRFSLSA